MRVIRVETYIGYSRISDMTFVNVGRLLRGRTTSVLDYRSVEIHMLTRRIPQLHLVSMDARLFGQ